MEALHNDLKTIVENYRKGELDFNTTITNFERLINEYATQSSDDIEINLVKNAFYKILHKIHYIENLNDKLKNYKKINNELRLAVGLQLK